MKPLGEQDMQGLRTELVTGAMAGSDDQTASLLVCAVAGALWRYGSMDSHRIAANHGISVLLVERALVALSSNNEAHYDRGSETWRMAVPGTFHQPVDGRAEVNVIDGTITVHVPDATDTDFTVADDGTVRATQAQVEPWGEDETGMERADERLAEMGLEAGRHVDRIGNQRRCRRTARPPRHTVTPTRRERCKQCTLFT